MTEAEAEIESLSGFATTGFPTQTSHEGDVLTTNGTTPMWLALTGEVKMFAYGTPPSGYLECDGSSLSRVTYAKLFAAIGVTYGMANETSFNLPDYRGMFLRGWDHGAGNDPDAAARTAQGTLGSTGDNVGTKQGCQIQSHSHSIPNRQLIDGNVNGERAVCNAGSASSSFASYAGGGNETRPVNINVMYVIKY
jgi:microcystin-dependent protein